MTPNKFFVMVCIPILVAALLWMAWLVYGVSWT